jgi:hypothetical protein
MTPSLPNRQSAWPPNQPVCVLRVRYARRVTGTAALGKGKHHDGAHV